MLLQHVPIGFQGVSGSNVYAAPNLDLLWKDDFSLMEFPKENLKFLEKLGEGQFGEVKSFSLPTL